MGKNWLPHNILSQVRIEKRPRVSTDQLPFKLKNTGAVRPVTCDLSDYFYGDRDATLILSRATPQRNHSDKYARSQVTQSGNPSCINSIQFESEASRICLSAGMSCNGTCGWESELDPNKTPYLRSEFTNLALVKVTTFIWLLRLCSQPQHPKSTG